MNLPINEEFSKEESKPNSPPGPLPGRVNLEQIKVGGRIKRLNAKKFFLGAGIGFLFSLILAAVIFGLGIYRFNWSGSTVHKITKIFPYPAVFVNWRAISFFEYQDDINTLKKFFESQQEMLGEASIPEEEELKNNVLERLIKNELSYQLAKKYDIRITDQDMEEELEKIIAQDESREQVEKILMAQYGWGIEKFKIKVLKPFLVQQKLRMAISKDENLNQEAKSRAEEILAKIKEGKKSFEELAEEYSEDRTAADGGDLGYFGKRMMVPEFEEAAFSLGVGETSDLVLTEYGYHIIKVEDQIKNDAGEVEQVRARHILIRTKDLDKILDEEMERAKIWKLVKI